MTSINRAAIFAASLALGAGGAAQAASYNFDISDGNGVPASSYAGAGVAGVWNATPQGVLSGAGFTDTTGTLGGVAMTITADFPIGGWGGPGDLNAVNGDFVFTAGSWSIDLTGLQDGAYIAILYAPLNPSVELGDGNVGGIGFSSVTGGSATLVLGLSHVLVPGVVVSGGTLSMVGSSPSLSGIAGVQLVGPTVPPVPVPAAGLLLLTGLGVMGAAARRRRG